ncbi:MAG: LysR family transcriptional regulator [Bacteroidota bacterium]|jgi:DNA-binding transcriptional LysR family regulator
MEFRELKTFQAVASLLSFNKAANVLNYAQSTVSSQIQSLEISLGKTLFKRTGNKISLTPAGVKLLDYTQRLINIEKEILSNFKNLDDMHGSLTIKTPQSVSACFFPSLLQEFQLIFPQIGFDIDWCTSYNLSDIFNSGVIDLAFLISDNFSDKFLQVEVLTTINLVIAAHPQDELIKQRSVSLKDLNGKTMIFVKSDCNYKKILQKMLVQSNIELRKSIEINSLDAVKQLLILGNGLALLPEMVIKDELDEGLLKMANWKGPAFNAKLYMIWNKQKHLSEPLKAFIYMVRKMI